MNKYKHKGVASIRIEYDQGDIKVFHGDDNIVLASWQEPDDAELDKYIDDEEGLSESGEYLLAAIKKWLKDNVMEVQWEAERTRLWTPWTK